MSGSGRSSGGGPSIYKLVILLPWVGLAAVGLALASGIPASRVRVVGAELILAALADAHVVLAGRATGRRARRQRAAGVRWGIHLEAPFWLRVYEPALGLTCGGLLAAVPASLGLPAFSVGVFLTVVVIGLGFPLSSDVLTPGGLTFEDAGLRVHFRRFNVLLAWGDIARVEAVGPDHFTMLMLHLDDPARIVAAVEPATPQARRKVQAAIGNQSPGTSLMLMPWTAGVDGIALMQALQAGRVGRRGPPALN